MPRPVHIVENQFNAMADRLVELTGTKSKVELHPLPTDDPKVRKPDITRARTMLGWEPTVPLREGVQRTIEYFREVLGRVGK